MRKPLLTRTPKRTQVASERSFPAPIGGWNAKDSLASMKPTDAVYLENFFPTPTEVVMRGGNVSHATGTTGNIKTLAVYNKTNGTNTMYAYTSSGIYDVTSAGAVGASKLARTNGKHQWTMFGDGTNNWLIAVNGVDAPAYFDGTTWTAVTGATSPALTGLTTTSIVSVCEFKGRLIFLENNSLSFWYLSSGVAGGALTKYDLSGEAPDGGYLMACGTWTRDAGNGPDDYFVAITSEGQAIIYEGTDPSSSVSWSKVGSYKIGKPLGRRCMLKYGADLVVLTQDGVFPLSALLLSGDEKAKYAFSYKIQSAFVESARSYGSTFGWRAIVYPEREALLVNVPLAEDGDHEQYVMNTTTKSWCKFNSWDAEDFAILNDDLYFADGTSTFKAWFGAADNGSNITYRGKHAFQTFGAAETKAPKMFMPILSVNGQLDYSIGIDVDFEDKLFGGTVTFGATGGALWGTAVWGTDTWGGSSLITRQWGAPTAYDGRWISVKLKIVSNAITGSWIGSTVIYEKGAGL